MEVLTYGQTLLTATENGYGKRTSIDEYPVQKRGGKGVITIKTNKRNGKVMTILVVSDEDEVMLVTDAGKIIRLAIGDISVISRNTQGVKLIDIDTNERLVSAARLAEQEDSESGDDGEASDDMDQEQDEENGD
jgi:DNA gyrase subunit A